MSDELEKVPKESNIKEANMLLWQMPPVIGLFYLTCLCLSWSPFLK